MTLKDLKVLFPYGDIKTFPFETEQGVVKKRILYVNPLDISNPSLYFSKEDWSRIKGMQRFCFLSSPKGKPNEVFNFYWGYGGTPEYRIPVTIKG